MSRAIAINATPQHIADTCTRLSVGISTIEPLADGGTRVVLMNGDAAARIRKAYGRKSSKATSPGQSHPSGRSSEDVPLLDMGKHQGRMMPAHDYSAEILRAGCRNKHPTRVVSVGTAAITLIGPDR